MNTAIWQSLILAAGIALAGGLVAGAVITTEPEVRTVEVEVPASGAVEPTFHEVWMPNRVQLSLVAEFGLLPSCEEIQARIQEYYDFEGDEGSDRLRSASEQAWATLECSE